MPLTFSAFALEIEKPIIDKQERIFFIVKIFMEQKYIIEKSYII